VFAIAVCISCRELLVVGRWWVSGGWAMRVQLQLFGGLRIYDLKTGLPFECSGAGSTYLLSFCGG
jgi:hypothetical protein